MEQQEPNNNESKPTPDPTTLTTQQMLREVERAKELLQYGIASVRDLTSEKFISVETQLSLIERQRVEQKKDTKDAVDAALAAAKEAVQEQTKASGEAIGKSEALTKTQLEQQNTTFNTGIASVVDKLDDLKDRIVRIETRGTVAIDHRNDQRLNIGQIVSIIAVVISAIAVILTVVLVP